MEINISLEDLEKHFRKFTLIKLHDLQNYKFYLIKKISDNDSGMGILTGSLTEAFSDFIEELDLSEEEENKNHLNGYLEFEYEILSLDEFEKLYQSLTKEQTNGQMD